MAACGEIVLKHLPQAKDQRDAYPEFVGACLAKVFDVSMDVIARSLRKGSPSLG